MASPAPSSNDSRDHARIVAKNCPEDRRSQLDDLNCRAIGPSPSKWHSYATGALKAGVSAKVVSDRIGHANVGFFLQTYAHVLGNDDRDAAEQAASFLIGAGLGLG
jgi:hypothetical protein